MGLRRSERDYTPNQCQALGTNKEAVAALPGIPRWPAPQFSTSSSR